MLAFKESNRRNHSKEAFLTLHQLKSLPPRLRHQLKWSRGVNTKGLAGKKVHCDLAIEHLNRHLKMMLSNAGSNISFPVILCVGKSLGVVSKVCDAF